MKATTLRRPGRVTLEEVPTPKLGRGELLVEMKACGVCGTDLEKVKGEAITPPILGHEVAGVISEVGVDVKGFHVGDRVFVHHHVPCHTCYYCRRRDYTLCPEFLETNIDPCGFAEYFRVPALNVSRGAVLHLPEGLSFDLATLIEPTACCLRALAKCRIRPGDTALVVGAGPVGLTHVQLLKALYGVHVVASDLIDFRVEAARKMGADEALNPSRRSLVEAVREATGGRGADLVIVASGSPKALGQGIEASRKGGVVCVFGAPPPKATLPLDLSDIFLREVSLVPSYSTSEVETNVALDLIASGRVELGPLITHRFELRRVEEAISLAMEGKDCLKIVVTS